MRLARPAPLRLALRDLREQFARLSPVAPFELRHGDQFRRAAEEGMIGLGQRIQFADHGALVHRIEPGRNLADQRQIAQRLRRACILGERIERGHRLFSIATAGQNRAAHHLGIRARRTAIGGGKAFEIVVGRLKIARLQIVERGNQHLAIGLTRSLLLVLPEEIARKGDEQQDDRARDRHAVFLAEALQIALADGIVHFADQRVVFGGLAACQFFFAGKGGFFRCESHERLVSRSDKRCVRHHGDNLAHRFSGVH